MTTAYSVLKTRLKGVLGDTNGVLADHYEEALQRAARETYPNLFRTLRDQTLRAGDSLPDSSFEDWPTSATLRFYTALSGTLAETTTAGLYHGPRSSTSAKYTAGAANDYFFISSDSFPRLLDLQDKTVSLYCWVYPEVTDDAYIVIYTKQNDSAATTQTLTSETTCYAGVWTLLKLENQSLNSDLDEIQIRLKVATNGKYVYFDEAFLGGLNSEIYLPTDFQTGVISNVGVQTRVGDLDDPNISGQIEPLFGTEPTYDGTYRFLRIPEGYNKKRIELNGYTVLEDTLDDDAETMSIDDPQTDLLVRYAAYLCNDMHRGVVGTDDISRLDYEAKRHKDEYDDNLRLRGTRTSMMITCIRSLSQNPR